METSTTLDGLLDRRVLFEQPAKGYRVAMDTILLAAGVRAFAGDSVLDIGCGVGGALLCLARRVPGLTGVGIEIQPELKALCASNIKRNGFVSRLSVIEADATNLPKELQNRFDHVLMNPPYHEASRHDSSANASKKTANTETDGDLKLWIASAEKALRPSGTLTIIHRADRRDSLLSLLEHGFGAVEILPIVPRKETPAKRILVRARKSEVFFVKERPPLVLHQESGAYTEEAEAILRHCQSVDGFRTI